MSIGPMGGLAGSAAGSPLSLAGGTEVDRARQDAVAAERRVQADQKAENAAGIGETDGENHETEERDADGRRLWEEQAKAKTPASEPAESTDRQSKDTTGQRGNLLDLSG
jgi:hypothetical protein